MNAPRLRTVSPIGFSLLLAVFTLLLAPAQANAQCPWAVIVPSLQLPLGITQTNQGNLLVSETASRLSNTGRITIVDPVTGSFQTLLDGLPSGVNDVNDPSGPTGLYMHGRTLYVVIGVGDSLLPGPVPNPNSSSPIFSSILAIHFSAAAEKKTTGFSLTVADHQALANGQKVTLSNGGGDKIALELIANFPDSTPDPISPSGFRNTNPFDLVVVDDQIYVTDGGQNLVWRVDIPTGTFSVLTTFARISNPLFINPTPPPPSIGGPFLDAVPTGIVYSGGELLVTLLRGFPFPPGVSVVERIDPLSGVHSPFITGLRTAIDVLPIKERGDTDYLVLQHNSGAQILPPWSGPGVVLRFETPADAPSTIASCLTRPSAMTLDERTGTLYVIELFPTTPLAVGRLVAFKIAP
jgi:hypothetical protein